MATLHLHLDESGDLNFSPRGTRYYVFAAAWTYDPAPLAHDLTTLRFSLLKAGHDVAAFHATNDRQVNRNAVVGILSRHAAWRFAALVIEKAKVYPDLYEPHRFYPRFASSVLKYVFRRHLRPDTGNVLVLTDTLPVKAKREAAEKAIKTACRLVPPPCREQLLAPGRRLLLMGSLQKVGVRRPADVRPVAGAAGRTRT